MIFTRQTAFVLVVLLILVILVAHVFACERAETEPAQAPAPGATPVAGGGGQASARGAPFDITQYIVEARP